MFPLSVFHREHKDKDRPADDRYLRLHEAKRYVDQWRSLPLRDLLEPVARILRVPASEQTYELLIKIHVSNDILELVEELTVEFVQ